MKKLVLVCLLIGSSMVQAQEWKKDLDKALSQAGNENKLVLLFFSVPEACDICMELDKSVFASEEFKAYARENFILAKPDFSESATFETKADNLLIVEKYNKDGFFPLVVILDKNSRVLGKVGIYNGETPQQYILSLQSIAKR